MQKKNQTSEVKYYGLHACMVLWQKRPQDVIRVYVEKPLLKKLSPLLQWCAQHKKAYHIVESEDLQRLTDSVHHEGICILAKEPAPQKESEMLSSVGGLLLYLDGVQNPHNVGSIIRSAAHFGVTHILGDKKGLPSLSASACRIAKGGAESVKLVGLDNPFSTLSQLKKKGFCLIGTSSHKGGALYQYKFPKKCIIIMGGESDGITEKLLSLTTDFLQIPGTGAVESLNVSVATSVLLSEYTRQNPELIR
jgi:RNA methyltransferase, TrmH family